MQGLRIFCRRGGFLLSIFAALLFLASCDLAKNQLQYDRAAELDRQDYRDALAPVPLPPQGPGETPDFQPMLSTPEELRLPSPLVTVSVNQTVSLRELLFELTDQAGIDVELDPQIRGSVIFTARERPFDEVVNRICEMAGLRYNFKNNVLRVELDRPYVKNYSVDYINVERTGSSDLSTSISLSTGGEGSISGGSSSEVSNSFDGDLWGELDQNLEQILTSSDTYTSLATMADPMATASNPFAAQSQPGANAPPPLPGSPQVNQMPPAVAPTLSVMTPMAEPLIPNAPATYSISPQSGIVSVFASERQHKMVAKFLDDFRRRATTLVLIEAKVLQVDLTDEFAAGIDWSRMNLTGVMNFDSTFTSPGILPEAVGSFTAAFNPGNDFQAGIDLISRFGTVRALSSPRVTVLNNQPAIVNMSQNNIYFSFDVESELDEDTNERTISVDSEQKSTPEGVLLAVVPTANPETGEIYLAVRPTVSKITSFISDPTIGFSLTAIGIDPTLAGVPDNQIPEVSVQEIDSILRLQSGQMIVMGGLMKDSNIQEQEGVPVLGDLPLVGSLFRNHSDSVQKSELVIFIRASIVPGSNVDDMDRKMYREFGLDRRPGRI